MQYKKQKPKKVILKEPPMTHMCHNKLCRAVLRGHFKILEFQDGKKHYLCPKCFQIWRTTCSG